MLKKILSHNSHTTKKKEKKKYTKLNEEQREDSILQLSKDIQNHQAFHNSEDSPTENSVNEVEEKDQLIAENPYYTYPQNGTNNTKHKIFDDTKISAPKKQKLSFNSTLELETFGSIDDYKQKITNLKIKRDKIKQDIKIVEKYLGHKMEKYYQKSIELEEGIKKIDKTIKKIKEKIDLITFKIQTDSEKIINKFENIELKLEGWLKEKEKLEYEKLNFFYASFLKLNCCSCCVSNPVKSNMRSYIELVKISDPNSILTSEKKIELYKNKLELLKTIDQDTDINFDICTYLEEIIEMDNSLKRKTHKKVNLLNTIDENTNLKIKLKVKYEKNLNVLKIAKRYEKLKIELKNIKEELSILEKNRSGSSLDYTTMQINDPEKFRNIIHKFRKRYKRTKDKILSNKDYTIQNGEDEDGI